MRTNVLKPDSEGKFWEEFWVLDGEMILARRATGKLVEKLIAKGAVRERYETDGRGNPQHPDVAAALDPKIDRATRRERFEAWRTAESDPGPTE